MPTYDAIVVGARCAGASTALLLARARHRVLQVDRATVPRRRLLDAIVLEAAATAGVEVREAFTMTDVVVEDGRVVGARGHGPDGRSVTERGRFVVGADGRGSRIARAVRAEAYDERPMLQWSAFSYFSGLPVDGFEIVIRPHRGWGAIGTNDGLTMVVVGWPVAEAHRYKADVEAHFFETLELAPGFAERARAARPGRAAGCDGRQRRRQGRLRQRHRRDAVARRVLRPRQRRFAARGGDAGGVTPAPPACRPVERVSRRW